MVSLLLTSSSLPFVDASSENGIFEQSNSIINAQNNFDSTQSYLHAKPTQTGPDKDGDGIKNGKDNCTTVSNSDQADTDGDGVGDACDNCPDVSNSNQADADGDGIGDVCEPDTDGDGVGDDVDNCDAIPNPAQEDTDGNGVGDACNSGEDADGDEYADNLDNCPTVSNPAQEDADGDGIGDLCEPDTDGDGVLDDIDNCPTVYNPAQDDVCTPEQYTFLTLSSNTGTQEGSIINPSDIVTITGVDTIPGTFSTSAILTGPDSALPVAANCTESIHTTSSFPYQVTCTVNGSFGTAGTYCWDVTVIETTASYSDSSDGTQLGANDPDNECWTTTVNYDRFGIIQLYPTAGRIFESHWDQGSPRTLHVHDRDTIDADQVVRGSNAEVVIDGNGIATMQGIKQNKEANPRIYVYDELKQDTWENTEMTVYMKRISEKKTLSYAGLNMISRSEHQDTNDDLNNGQGYAGRFTYNGRTQFVKEVVHGSVYENADTKFHPWSTSNGEFPFNQWIGGKLITYSLPDGNVKLELYMDLTDGANGGDWQLTNEFIDDGTWEGDIFTGPATSVYLKNDGLGEAQFKYFSVREIDIPENPELRIDSTSKRLQSLEPSLKVDGNDFEKIKSKK